MTRLAEDKLPFTRAEYQMRLDKVRQAMAERGIDFLIACDPSNMAWLSGYDGWSFYVPQAILVEETGEPVFWGRLMDAAGARHTVYMDSDNITAYTDDYVMSEERHAYDHLSALIEERGHAKKRIGVEMDNYYFSARAFAILQARLPNVEFVDATNLVNWQRLIKSDAEIAFMKRAGTIVENMHNRIRETVRPGIRKCDLIAEIYDASLRGTDEFGGDYPAIVPMVPSGPEASAAHLTWNDKLMATGEGTFFEIAGCYRRYHCPLCRTVYLGKPPQKFMDVEAAVLDGIAAGLEAAKPGNVAQDLVIAFSEALAKHGLKKDGRSGYPIGLSYPPDWGERTVSIRTGDLTELKPNMTFHFMTAFWMEDSGYEVTESIRITENGAELLANVPRPMLVID
ncbi:MAG: ectoine hydrolase DoeA [Pseudomonadota bacterium]